MTLARLFRTALSRDRTPLVQFLDERRHLRRIDAKLGTAPLDRRIENRHVPLLSVRGCPAVSANANAIFQTRSSASAPASESRDPSQHPLIRTLEANGALADF